MFISAFSLQRQAKYFFNWLDGPNIWLFLDNHDIIVEPRTVCGDFSLRSGPRAAETWSDSLSSPSLHICRHVQCAMCNVHPPFTILSWNISTITRNSPKLFQPDPNCECFCKMGLATEEDLGRQQYPMTSAAAAVLPAAHPPQPPPSPPSLPRRYTPPPPSSSSPHSSILRFSLDAKKQTLAKNRIVGQNAPVRADFG